VTESKLEKFSEYLISKIMKRQD